MDEAHIAHAGRPPSDPDTLIAEVDALVDRHHAVAGDLLQLLVALQHRYHCVPPTAADRLADRLGVSHLRPRGVVSFYSFLSETHQGEYVFHFSDNVTDQMAGSRRLFDQLCRALGVVPGETRGDGRVSVQLTSCTGLCDQGPAALVNYLPLTRLSPERLDAIASLVERRIPVERWPRELFRVDSNIRRSDALFRRPVPPGEGLRKSLERGGPLLPDWHDDFAPHHAERIQLERGGAETLKELYKSELRGRGGAGFKSAIKWESVRNAREPERYVLCNADEGEPGTFKDRVLLTEYADMVFEGMTICAHVVGARHGVLYLRQEYNYLVPHLEAVLARRREASLLGDNILGSALDFDIAIHLGAGAYIAGMETAMIKSIEGRRAIPRRRWPLPVHQGYFKRPTVVNNVETFAAATIVSAKGGAWFAAQGTEQSTGTKLFCVSGDCERPGIYEYPWGIPLTEVLRDAGAHDVQAVQVGGPSGMLIGPADFSRALAFEDIPSVGTLMIFDRRRDLFAIVDNFTRFFQHESCGLCTPCRVGTTLLAKHLAKFERGWGSPVDLAEMERLGDIMRQMSHCGLGQTAANPILDSINRFPGIYQQRMHTTEFVPAFDLDGALAEARALTGRSDPAAHLDAEGE